MGRSQLRLGLGVLLVVLLMAAGTYVLGVDAGSRIHDQSGHTWHHPDAQLFATTKYGLAKLIQQPDYQTNMPIYDGVLNDSEIIAVLSWIKAQWPKETQARHDQANAQYQKSLKR